MGKTNGFNLFSLEEGQLIEDEFGKVHCFLGYIPTSHKNSSSWLTFQRGLPKGDEIYQLVQIQGGMIHKVHQPDGVARCRPLNKHAYFPHGTQLRFGVLDNEANAIDEELTRLLFGGSPSEIVSIAKALSKLIGRGYTDEANLPRVTFAKTRDNTCNLTGCLIPMGFPYVTFGSSSHEWSHLSLNGFYRVLHLLCKKGSALRVGMDTLGIDPHVLDGLLGAAETIGNPIHPGD